ncbi:glutaredoxin-like protein YDR286C [Striga asiatica]|uniref:Glutaredoxin-like protein n=1 Tax=Striga asiatica TaxID=4170 RepID=A0A5A7Q1E8_STRAF|nr:glutaredoxin-like protein YDR286C [Striga asiatica]
MAARVAIGNYPATRTPLLFQHFRSSVEPAGRSYRFPLFGPLASFSSASQPKKLVLYSKPGCCLCDGLKEKLDTVFSSSGPNYVGDVQLEIRDITSNPEWERLYQYEIPVLTRVREDGTEEILPRFSPRAAVELVQKKIAAAFS